MTRLFVVCENFDARYGGPAYSMPNLSQELADQYEVEFHSIEWFPDENNSYLDNSRWTVHSRNGPAKLGMSVQMWRELLIRVGSDDIVHLNNLWNAVALLAFVLRLVKGCSLIVSTRGALQRGSLKTGNLRKKLAWVIFQKKCLTEAAVVIAASDDEKEAIWRKVPGANIVLIKNTTHLPECSSIRSYESRPTRVLYLGRLHEHKRIKMLLNMWLRRPDGLSKWELIFAGPDYGGYLPSIKRLEKRGIYYAGIVSGEEKTNLLNSARLLVLPSKSENYGVVVAEALASAVPVLVSDTTPWRHLSKMGAGLAVEIECFEERLFSLLQDQRLLLGMSRKARSYALQNLGWKESRDQYRNIVIELSSSCRYH